MFVTPRNFHLVIFHFFCVLTFILEIGGYAITSETFIGSTNSIQRPHESIELQTYTGSSDLLSFLDEFIVCSDRAESVKFSGISSSKRINKRSAALPKVSHFMLDLYKRLLDKRLIPNFDTARSLRSLRVGCSANCSAERALRLVFDVSHLPDTEEVKLAQLILHGRPRHRASKRPTVDIYHVTAGGTSKMTSPITFGSFRRPWLTANATLALREVLRDRAAKRLTLDVQVLPRDLLDLDWTAEEGPQLLVLTRTVVKGPAGQDPELLRMRRSLENRTAVPDTGVVRNLASNSSHAVAERRYRRSGGEDEEAELEEEQSNYITEDVGRRKGSGRGGPRRKKNPCRRKPLHVNFSAINYDQWIIAPPSYEAWECSGRCSFPLGAHLSPTKHAVIQTLMHSLEPRQVARASCVPTRLTPISVLYVDADGIVTYKYDYDEMVVAECGCR